MCLVDFFYIPALEGLSTYRPDHTCGGPATIGNKKQKPQKLHRGDVRAQGCQTEKLKKQKNTNNPQKIIKDL